MMSKTLKRPLNELSFSPELSEGARNAVNVCLRIQPAEKTTLITDEATAEIAAAIAKELDRRDLVYKAFVLEDYASRPLVDMPAAVLHDMESSQVSIFAVQAQMNELKTRMQMTDVVNRRQMRHAHMVNITSQIMCEGMRADFIEVDRLSQKVWELASAARSIRATTVAGTDITAALNPQYKWIKTSGIISPKKWGNLPGGETFTTPGEVNGIFVIDGVVGDYLCAKYGSLRDAPLTIRIEGNRLVEAHSSNKMLEEEFWKYTHTDENSDRVGEFAIGTNLACKDVIGNILQDEKIPGIHIAFGNPYGAHTGADWFSITHIDVVGRDFSIWIDGRPHHGTRPISPPMIPELRERFNANFTPASYATFLSRLNERCGEPVKFRNCETPCFFPSGLLDRMATAGREMSEQLIANPEYLANADAQIPPEFRVPHTDSEPLFVQADFGVIRNAEGELEPRLVEIQGFPSIYAYQMELAETYREVYRLPDDLHYLPGGLTPQQYRRRLAHAILGDQDPEQVVLLEVDPWAQKTSADFLLTGRLCGVRTIDVTDVRKEGNRLVYERDGRTVPITRIYNRVIADELIRKQIPLDFDFRDDLSVEWAGHPSWFFRVSKFSLPYLRHPFVPSSRFLDRVESIPEDSENYVLKPLFSFAGLGVVVGPTHAEIEAIPSEQRSQYLLQERVRFEPTIQTPFGPTNAEIRIMYINTGQLEPVTTIVRMGRGKMMGVNQNRDLEWVGASAGFSPLNMLT